MGNNRIYGGIKRAALYTRVSTDEQAQRGESLPEQMAALEKFAAENGLKIVDRYVDAGHSAFTSYKKRPEFMRLLDDIKSDKVDIVLFIKLDRWFRRPAPYYEVQSILDAHRVQWLTTEEDYDTTTANGRAMLGMRLVMAQAESDNTSDRIKFVFKGKKARGEVVTGCVPLGFKIENKHLVVVPGEADRVRGIFDTFLCTRSAGATQRWYNNTFGEARSVDFIKKRLSDTKYIGLAYGNPHFCPAIIDAETFRLAQELRQQRAPRNSSTADRVYLFSGIIRCAECGAAMHSDNSRGINYYRCRRHQNYGNCINRRRMPEREIEEFLLTSLISTMEAYNAELIQRQKARKKPSNTDKLKRKLDKLRGLYLDDLISREDYERDFRQISAALEAAAEVQAPRAPVNIPVLEEALGMYKTLPLELKKAFWSKVIKQISVSADKDIFVSPL